MNSCAYPISGKGRANRPALGCEQEAAIDQRERYVAQTLREKHASMGVEPWSYSARAESKTIALLSRYRLSSV